MITCMTHSLRLRNRNIFFFREDVDEHAITLFVHFVLYAETTKKEKTFSMLATV